MSTWILAYANKSTDYRWVLWKKFDTAASATHELMVLKDGALQHSALGVFLSHRDPDLNDWEHKRPFRIANRHVLAESSGYGCKAASDWINSKDSTSV